MLLQEEQQGCDWFSDEAACPTGTEGQPPPEEGEAGSEQNCGGEKQVLGRLGDKADPALGTLPRRAESLENPSQVVIVTLAARAVD